MRIRHLQLVVTFATTTAAMEMERKAEEEQIPGRLIPLPSEISAGCGLAWKTELSEKESLIRFLEQAKLRWEAVYECSLF